MERRIGMLFDCLRAPYDVAHIIQVASAIGNYDLYLTGNSIDTKNRKIITKVKSWGIKNIPEFQHIGSFEEGITWKELTTKYTDYFFAPEYSGSHDRQSCQYGDSQAVFQNFFEFFFIFFC